MTSNLLSAGNSVSWAGEKEDKVTTFMEFPD